MYIEPGPLGEPRANQRRLVGAIVVHDDVHVDVGRHPGLRPIEELPELGRAMAAVLSAMTFPVFVSSAANKDVVS